MAKKLKTRSRSFSGSKKRAFLTCLLIALVLAVGFLGWKHYRSKNTMAPVSASSSKVTPTPASGNATRKQVTQNTIVNQGGAQDKNGQSPGVSTPSGQWSSSEDGLITLKAPLKDGIFKNGDSIYGAASSGPVQFRLIDDQVGVIAQGTINVVDGNFSAAASFKPYGSSGRLDVFNTDQNGKEINEVQVSVNF